MLTSIIAMIICVIFSAYFSATETAFSSSNKTRFKALAEKGNKKAKLAYRLSEEYDKLISTILIGNNIVNIAVASIGTVLFIQLLGEDIGATVSTIVVTVIVLIFGEITPKSFAKDFPERFAMFSSPFINFLIKLLLPLNFIFSAWKKFVSRLFKTNEDNKMSQEELLLLLDEVEQDGTIDETENELLHNAVEFGDLDVQSILTHRVDLVGVDITASKEEIAEKFTTTRYSRLLVYENTIDKIVGIIHLKDFYKDTGISEKNITELMSPPVFIHQTEKVNSLLRLLQSSKSHIAIVVDEYGGTLGIVTMEDILEELVGEIWDEHDEVEEDYSEIDESTFLVDCSVALEDFCDRFDIDGEFESVSLGGWIMDQIGCIPNEGDHFDYNNLTITVVETDNHRVETVRVKINTPLPEEV